MLFDVGEGESGLLVVSGFVNSGPDDAAEACARNDGRWLRGPRVCARAVDSDRIYTHLAPTGFVSVLTPESVPRRVVLDLVRAAAAALPSDPHTTEVRERADRAAPAPPLTSSAPGWPWLVQSARLAEGNGDDDGCTRLALDALAAAPPERAVTVVEVAGRCAEVTDDEDLAVEAWRALGPHLGPEARIPVAARLLHIGRPEEALLILDPLPGPDADGYRVLALVQLRRLDEALELSLGVEPSARIDLGRALIAAGRREEGQGLVEAACAEEPGSCPRTRGRR